MSKCVLLVLDVQTLLIQGHPYQERNVIDNMKRLIFEARNNQTEVLYVRHDGGEGSELCRGTDGWQIYAEVAPVKDEKVFDKQYSSAFLKTGLGEYLESKSVTTIVLVGMQTEYCMDATCKSAFEHGYRVIIPEGTNTTYDNDYLPAEKLVKFYNDEIWNNRFVNVVTMDEAVKIVTEGR